MIPFTDGDGLRNYRASGVRIRAPRSLRLRWWFLLVAFLLGVLFGVRCGG